MSVKVTVGDMYRAVPVLRRIAQAKLHPTGAMYLAQVIRVVEDAIKFYEDLRLEKLRSVSVLAENGDVSWHEVVDEQGKTRQEADYKSPEAREEMLAFTDEILKREIEIPHRIKRDHLLNPGGESRGAGYALSAEECLLLGNFLSYKGLTPIVEED